jgi:hypothetical protein
MSTLEIATEKQVHRLRHDSNDNVVVYPPDNDIHVMPAKEAVKAILRSFSPVNKLMSFVESGMQMIGEQSAALVERLQDWSKEHSHIISRADMRVLSHDDFLFVVMQKEVPYNFDLSDKLTDLDLEIANDSGFDKVTLNVLAIPRCSSEAAQAFIDWERTICIANFTENI